MPGSGVARNIPPNAAESETLSSCGFQIGVFAFSFKEAKEEKASKQTNKPWISWSMAETLRAPYPDDARGT